jgi:membrane protease YdiL (CAAX protease family)
VICEEIMFRGYFIERVEELTGSMWTAAILSCVLFGLAHASGWGFGAVFVNAAVGTAYATLYVWRRNLPACMVVHFATDAPVLWLPLSLPPSGYRASCSSYCGSPAIWFKG